MLVMFIVDFFSRDEFSKNPVATLQSDVQVRMLALGDVIMYTECIHNYFLYSPQTILQEVQCLNIE